ncbi:MAG TPA: cyclic nucleotide-binding domain-containing protein [Roseiflexaceae bacterium]|nr:cyclic nucleotide-binding domain-containing protein [Roseiflexaceae bacterium]HMP40713.1 cyclic nucleotide-binding domain-containing protein [Roseiflexaceae bacterium]
MSTRVIDNLRQAELFTGLADDELARVVAICRAARVGAGLTVFSEGDSGTEMYIIHEGCVRVMINTRAADGSIVPSTINTLYAGQCFGEGALLGGASRSASVAAVEQTTLIVIREIDFSTLCRENPHIGYTVMRNLAQDLAYKLNSSNLLLRGNIRWRGDELARS